MRIIIYCVIVIICSELTFFFIKAYLFIILIKNNSDLME